MQQPLCDGPKPQSPALFLLKLRKILDDTSTNDIITWNSTGDGFVIQDQVKFSFQILPKYYNHNNLCSFIRQLNMYGFHKVMLLETKDRDKIEYAHQYFSKDEPDAMAKIERKLSSTTKTVLKDFEQIQGRQVEIDVQLEALQRENALLWREMAVLRQKHLKQQELVNKIIEFLVAVIHNDRAGKKRRGVLLESVAPTKKIGIEQISCGENGSAVLALVNDARVVDENNVDSQGGESLEAELSGILDNWNTAVDGNNLEEVLDFDQLIDIHGNLEASEEGKIGEKVLDGNSEILTEGPAYLNL